MDRTERFYRIDQLLHERRLVSTSTFLAELEVSRATLKRDIQYMRDRLNAPIEWDRDAGGYRFAEPEEDSHAGRQYELPGLWFNASEVYALLTMLHLVSGMQPGILAPQVKPLEARLRALLGAAASSADEVQRRVRLLDQAARAVEPKYFEVVGSALLRRKRLHIRYYARSTDQETEREVSPQRLVHYRDNWYLDAWCHLRKGLRSFAMDSIRLANVLERPARNVADSSLDQVLGAGYGIFMGRRVQWAKLRFTPERARWVSKECWHPRQKGRFAKDGSWLLSVPYADDRELLMDILRHGPEVEVLAPASLRTRLRAALDAARARYGA